eukprot:512623_1
MLTILLFGCFLASNIALRSWYSHSTLPSGITGAMTSFNSTANTISILTPINAAGKAYFDYVIHDDTFIQHSYPSGNAPTTSMTGNYASIDDSIYFVNVTSAVNPPIPPTYLYSFSITTQQFSRLIQLPGHPSFVCVTKSFHGKYLFILEAHKYANSFYVYDVHNNDFLMSLPPISNVSHSYYYGFGCLAASDGYLYIVGGTNYLTSYSSVIWCLDISNLSTVYVSEWIQIEDKLPYAPFFPFIVEFKSIIYIIGGYNPAGSECSADLYYLLHGNNTFSLNQGPSIPNAMCYAAGIVTNHRIYLFGGQPYYSFTSASKKWICSNDMNTKKSDFNIFQYIIYGGIGILFLILLCCGYCIWKHFRKQQGPQGLLLSATREGYRNRNNNPIMRNVQDTALY